MTEFFDAINDARNAVADNIQKSFAPTDDALDNVLEKGKRAAVGEIRTWGGVKMQKTQNGWVPVKNGNRQGANENEVSVKSPSKNSDFKEINIVENPNGTYSLRVSDFKKFDEMTQKDGDAIFMRMKEIAKDEYDSVAEAKMMANVALAMKYSDIIDSYKNE